MANIQKIAEGLVNLSFAEVQALARILAMEYGVSAKEDVALRQDIPNKTERFFLSKESLEKELHEVAIVREAKRRAEKKQWFVPKTIGKPCKVLLKRRK